jgi:S-DNA-T family DNA segregation ATPase FtsK/SpoIIIE
MKQSKKRNTKKTEKSTIFYEVAIVVTILICILLFLSNFGLIGPVGDFLSNVIFGLFGLLAYVIPLILLPIVIYGFLLRKEKLSSNKNKKNKANLEKINRLRKIKIILALIALISFCVLVELIVNPSVVDTEILEFYTNSVEMRGGGGLIGGVFTSLSVALIGVLGAYITTIIILFICIIVLTGKPLLSLLGTRSVKAYGDVKKHHDNITKKREERKQEKQNNVILPSENIITEDFDHTSKEPNGFLKSILSSPPKKVEHQIPKGRLYEIYSGSKIGDQDEHTSLDDEYDYKEDLYDTYNQDETEDAIKDYPVKISPVENTYMDETTKDANNSSKGDMATKDVADATPISNNANEYAYKKPAFSLLAPSKKKTGKQDAELVKMAGKLESVLNNFGVKVTVTNASQGPSVTRYELQPEQGVKVARIVGLADDIKLNLAVPDIRIEAPIPGKAAVGIEVPNKESTPVLLRELLEAPEFQNNPSNISFAVGRDIAGKIMIADIAKMPHLLIAGATGAGKSVCINTLIMSILYKADPKDVKLIMIDPKVVELSVYNGIPHLLYEVVTDPKKAAGALNWAVAEMTRRYQLLAELNVRDIYGYNEKVAKLNKEKKMDFLDDEQKNSEEIAPLPQIVIIVDELADLMMVAPSEVEGAICRLAQLARAAGIHLIVATQRPSVNVITGLIKANMPSRIAFSVASGVDSRTIIDMNGAEKLLGRGDMLFYPSGYAKPIRVQGSFISDNEVHRIVDFLKNQKEKNIEKEEPMILEEQEAFLVSNYPGSPNQSLDDDRDNYFAEAGFLIIEKEKASIGMLQRMFKIGFNRAARIMDQLHESGVVSGEEGTKPRNILMSKEDFQAFLEEKVAR